MKFVIFNFASTRVNGRETEKELQAATMVFNPELVKYIENEAIPDTAAIDAVPVIALPPLSVKVTVSDPIKTALSSPFNVTVTVKGKTTV